MISARALGVYTYLYLSRSKISAEALSGVFTEGREAMSTTLRELRDLGLIETKKQRVGGRIMTLSRVVDPENWTPETRLLFQEVQRNKQLLRNSNFYLYLPNIPAEPGDEEEFLKVNLEGGKMSDFPAAYDPDDIDQARRRQTKQKHEAKVAHLDQKADQRMQRRSMDPAAWSVTDSAFEFGSRMFNLFHVKPWQVTKSRFRIALANARNTYGTDGVVENQMYDLFFKQISQDKKLDNPEIIWKKFISQFESLRTAVERSTVTEEKLELAEVQASKSLDKLKAFAEEEGL